MALFNLRMAKSDNFRYCGKGCEEDLALIKLAETSAVDQVVLGHLTTFKGEKWSQSESLGYSNTVSEGIISSLHTNNGVKIIQTTASIDSGSSGGALFDQQGRLIGVTTSGVKESNANINFAVSVSELNSWQSIMSSSYDAIKLQPIGNRQPDVLRNLSIGMTKAQVKSIEKAKLVHETATELGYRGAVQRFFNRCYLYI